MLLVTIPFFLWKAYQGLPLIAFSVTSRLCERVMDHLVRHRMRQDTMHLGHLFVQKVIEGLEMSLHFVCSVELSLSLAVFYFTVPFFVCGLTERRTEL